MKLGELILEEIRKYLKEISGAQVDKVESSWPPAGPGSTADKMERRSDFIFSIKQKLSIEGLFYVLRPIKTTNAKENFARTKALKDAVGKYEYAHFDSMEEAEKAREKAFELYTQETIGGSLRSLR